MSDITYKKLEKELYRLGMSKGYFSVKYLKMGLTTVYTWKYNGNKIPEHQIHAAEEALKRAREEGIPECAPKKVAKTNSTKLILRKLDALEAKINKLLADKSMRPVKKLVFKPTEEIHYSQLVQ